MKAWYTVVFPLIVCSVLFDAWQQSEDSGKLTVIIEGIDNTDGKILIALNNSKENYEDKDRVFRGAHLDITGRQVIYTFENLPYGEYAIKTFHDENTDGELNKNILGMPTERYGFSNNARGTLGPATWEDAKFKFDSGSDTLMIQIK